MHDAAEVLHGRLDTTVAVLLLEHSSRWGMGQRARTEDEERVARAHRAAHRINPDNRGSPFTLAEDAEKAFVDQALWLMPADAPMRRRYERQNPPGRG